MEKTRRRILSEAWSQLMQFRKRYSHLVELSKVIEGIDALEDDIVA